MALEILWLLVPAPFVGYLVAQWGRMAFSDDPKLIRRLVEAQPVTMIAALTIVGAAALWVTAVVVQRFVIG